MLSCCFAMELKSQKILVMALHPGWVQTDMGGDQVSFSRTRLRLLRRSSTFGTVLNVIVLYINGDATMEMMLSLAC